MKKWPSILSLTHLQLKNINRGDFRGEQKKSLIMYIVSSDVIASKARRSHKVRKTY